MDEEKKALKLHEAEEREAQEQERRRLQPVPAAPVQKRLVRLEQPMPVSNDDADDVEEEDEDGEDEEEEGDEAEEESAPQQKPQQRRGLAGRPPAGRRLRIRAP